MSKSEHKRSRLDVMRSEEAHEARVSMRGLYLAVYDANGEQLFYQACHSEGMYPRLSQELREQWHYTGNEGDDDMPVAGGVSDLAPGTSVGAAIATIRHLRESCT